jgi:hypothetical protein
VNSKKVRGQYCWPHINGVPPGMPAFYNDGCVTCAAKLVAGKVAANTPPSQSQIAWKNRVGGECRHRAIENSKEWKAKLGAKPR